MNFILPSKKFNKFIVILSKSFCFDNKWFSSFIFLFKTPNLQSTYSRECIYWLKIWGNFSYTRILYWAIQNYYEQKKMDWENWASEKKLNQNELSKNVQKKFSQVYNENKTKYCKQSFTMSCINLVQNQWIFWVKFHIKNLFEKDNNNLNMRF